ncbi:MAG TPA: phosphotransferase [Acidimicrobiales bacterium]|nr:phosphotransferase [Acidimicrobiales bacterium]
MHRLARPPDAALDWAAEVVGSPITSVTPLTGGMSTGIHLLVTAGGERVVMRRFLNEHWLAIDPDLAPREAAVLQALEATPVPAPAFVGVDPYGARCGAPTVLMGFVPGRRTVLDDHRRLAGELARALAMIHDLPVPAVEGLPDETERIVAAFAEDRPNRHGGMPTARFWAEVRAGYAAVTIGTPVLLHNDLHPGNVLFDGDRLSAVVDWPLASSGHAACDVSFCRLDVALMLGPDAADLVLAAYEAETGRPLADVGWWDLVAASRAETDLPVWTESYAGLADVDLATVTARFDAFVAAAR